MAGSENLTVDWTAPDPPHGILTQYEVKYWSTQSLSSRPIVITLAPSTTLFHMQQLQPNASYGIQVSRGLLAYATEPLNKDHP